MRVRPLLSLTLCLSLFANPAFSAKDGSIPMKYEGGSLPLKQHDGLKVLLSPDTIKITQGKQSFAVPSQKVTEVSYGNDVHRRVGAAIGVAAVTLGIGAMLLLVKTKKHYVGIVWDGAEMAGTPPKGGAVFKVGKGEYRGFLSGLEGVTGRKAVNADSVGSGGTSK